MPVTGVQAMTKSRVVTELRRDASILWRFTVAVVLIGFASLAIAAAVYDFLPLRR